MMKNLFYIFLIFSILIGACKKKSDPEPASATPKLWASFIEKQYRNTDSTYITNGHAYLVVNSQSDSAKQSVRILSSGYFMLANDFETTVHFSNFKSSDVLKPDMDEDSLASFLIYPLAYSLYPKAYVNNHSFGWVYDSAGTEVNHSAMFTDGQSGTFYLKRTGSNLSGYIKIGNTKVVVEISNWGTVSASLSCDVKAGYSKGKISAQIDDVEMKVPVETGEDLVYYDSFDADTKIVPAF